MKPAERYFCERGRYGEVARKVDLCMTLMSRPCTGGECDLGAPCDRHWRVSAVVDRYLRLKRRQSTGGDP